LGHLALRSDPRTSSGDRPCEFTRAILAEDRPTRRAIDPTTWIKKTDYPELEFELSFRSFARQRARLLAFLKSLPEKSWSRTAILTRGPARERTVLFHAHGRLATKRARQARRTHRQHNAC
jgi:hypothetical protein